MNSCSTRSIENLFISVEIFELQNDIIEMLRICLKLQSGVEIDRHAISIETLNIEGSCLHNRHHNKLTEISSNSIEVNTLGKTMNLKPGAFKCNPDDWTSRLSFFEMVLYGMATERWHREREFDQSVKTNFDQCSDGPNWQLKARWRWSGREPHQRQSTRWDLWAFWSEEKKEAFLKRKHNESISIVDVVAFYYWRLAK